MEGFLLVYKPTGMTSFDLIRRLRRYLKVRKIGHVGTLDPMASGLMVVTLGKTCKYLAHWHRQEKEYYVSFQLGMLTDTLDTTGTVLATREQQPITDLSAVLQGFLGEGIQIPPLYSAIKVQGKKLYQYARHQEAVELTPRPVHFYQLEALGAQCFRVQCSKGTYIRSLCRDLGEATGNYASMSWLMRSRIGEFHVREADHLSDIAQGKYTLHLGIELLQEYPQSRYQPVSDIFHGKKIKLSTEDEVVLIVGEAGEALALYQREEGDTFRVLRGLF